MEDSRNDSGGFSEGTPAGFPEATPGGLLEGILG